MEILMIVAGAFLCFWLQKRIYLKKWDKNLKVTLEFSKHEGIEGETLLLKETLENRKILPLFLLRVKFDVAKGLYFLEDGGLEADRYYRNDNISVLMYQRIIRDFEFVLKQRGYYSISKINLVGTDIFLSSTYIKIININQSLYVYPRYCNCEELNISYQKILGTLLTKRYINEDPFEFRGIRDYETFDTMKSVNWKATAKTGALKVNLNDYTSTRQVKIYLNLENEFALDFIELKEEGIRIAATLSDQFIREGIPVSFYTNGYDCLNHTSIQIPSGSGKHHMKIINEGLSRIDLNKSIGSFLGMYEKDLILAKETDYIILISTYKHTNFLKTLLELESRKQDYYWLCPLRKGMDFHIALKPKNYSALFLE